MKRFLALSILIFTCAVGAQDLSEFGVKTEALSKEQKFEKAVAEHIAAKLEKAYEKDRYEVTVTAKWGKRVIASSSNIQLGMLGTVVNMAPSGSNASHFLKRIEELNVEVGLDSRFGKKDRAEVAEITKKQLTFLPEKVVKVNVSPVKMRRPWNWNWLKDYQVLWAALFIAGAVFAGFKYLTEQVKAPLAQFVAAGYLPAPGGHQGPKVELIPGPADFRVGLVFEEDHFFKLPLVVQQAVIAFSSFAVIQEVYTLLSPKYKKLFWSCLPQEYQRMPERKLMKQASTIQEVEKCQAWEKLSQEVHVYIRRNPELVATLHPEVRHYFPGIGEQGHEDAS